MCSGGGGGGGSGRDGVRHFRHIAAIFFRLLQTADLGLEQIQQGEFVFSIRLLLIVVSTLIGLIEAALSH